MESPAGVGGVTCRGGWCKCCVWGCGLCVVCISDSLQYRSHTCTCKGPAMAKMMEVKDDKNGGDEHCYEDEKFEVSLSASCANNIVIVFNPIKCLCYLFGGGGGLVQAYH